MSKEADALYDAYREAQDRVSRYSRGTNYLNDLSRLRHLLADAEQARQAWLRATSQSGKDAA